MKCLRTLLPLLGLAGCAAQAPDTAIRVPLSVRPEATVASNANGAIFQAGSIQPRPSLSLFEDRRARHVGDTLTVALMEKTEAKRKSETTDERSASASIDVPAPVLLGKTRGIKQTTWEPSGSSTQEFSDDETNSNSVSGTITVTVVEVLANGHLVVAGEKQLAINNDTEYIRLAGVVNPAQIAPGNTVKSTQLANVQFESKNSQGLDRSHLNSMLARFFLTLLPF